MGGAREAVWKPSPPEMRAWPLSTKERRHEEGLQEQRNRAGIRGGVRLDRPMRRNWNETPCRHGGGRPVSDRHDRTHRRRKDGQDQIEPCQCRPSPMDGFVTRIMASAFATACTTRAAHPTTWSNGAPINIPCGSINTVVGKARTR